jgi:hypothetical protein
MTVEFTAKDTQGNELSTNYSQLLMDLKEAGHEVVGADPSGMSFALNTPNGQVTVPVAQILQQAGYTVSNAMPISANYETVDPHMRYAISQLGNPDSKKAYIEEVLRRKNPYMQPQIMGQGEDWHYYDPQSQRWNALTNKPGMDLSDIGEYGPMAAKMGAAAVGAGVGGVAGGIPGMMAGGAAGSALANTFIRGQLLAGDEAFSSVTSPMEQIKEAAPEVLTDAAIPGALGVAGKFLPKLAKAAPVSAIARGTGQVLDTAGAGISKAATVVANNPHLRGLYTAANPLTQAVDLAGFGMQAPAWLTKAGARGLGHAGQNRYVKAMVGEDLAGGLENASKALLQTKTAAPWGERVAAKLGGRAVGAEESSAANVLSNLGESAGRQLGTDMERLEKILRQSVAKGEITPEQMGEIFLKEWEKSNAREAVAGKIGLEAGNLAEGASNLGKVFTRAADKATGAQLRTAQGVGAGMRAVGAPLRTAGQIARPLEPYMWARGMGGPWAEEQIGNLTGINPSQKYRNQGIINSLNRRSY